MVSITSRRDRFFRATNYPRRLFVGVFASALVTFAGTTFSATPATAKYDRAGDPHDFTVFMKDGGWCWFQDPRAIVHNGKLIMGSVKGNGAGEALIGVYDLRTNKSLGNFVAHPEFDRDDHNSPVFFPRKDGSVLAVYARHGHEKQHYYRISDPQDYTKWGEQMILDHSNTLKGKDQATYMNLYKLSAEGTLYNFFRGINFNPCVVMSSDEGLTWGKPVHLIANEVGGRQRPYVRYASNGIDTVFMSFTDAHPRDFGNSIYYAEYRGGNFYKIDGTFIKNLKNDGPLRPSEADLVYKGSGESRRGRDLSAKGAAWNAAIEIDQQGRPHMGYTLYHSNTDNRFRLAFWDGTKWIDREIAYAGKCLYDSEASYTGLIALDPKDPSVVFISTDVDPSTGKDSRGKHEIYRAKIGPTDDISSIKWTAVTENSKVRNIRPMILRDGDARIVLWNRGDFQTYLDYHLDTVGFLDDVDQ